jgi:hypothetical protein
MENGLGFEAGAQDRTEGKAAVREEEIESEVGDDMWARDVSEGRKKPAYPFGCVQCWAMGRIWLGPVRFPCGLLSFFIFFLFQIF